MSIGRNTSKRGRCPHKAGTSVFGRRDRGHAVAVSALSLVFLLATDASGELRAEARKARIVGLGATTCQRFNDDVRDDPVIRRDYLAWAQGFMSGIILSRPPGVDDGLDLNPATFDLINQLHFLEDHCARNVTSDFSDAVERLYKRLRQEGKT
ncbi:hypothetical protein [Bradyrhizobium sp. BR13661]|jgi:hypothetical protein|uniref:hypothetical protein n=1 Tax=Bradyrhizobium sp. BR13661 TaxID=2940622 RepID=UPI00247447A1|nr:hypothetical protein [Bradyrhizobium sp. BR13661]MDH6262222.1 hypothetical protein [Bradyrhizobium sp. BR13661]